MTNQDWKELQEYFEYARYGSQKFLIDGYKVSIEKVMTAENSVAYFIYIDGRFKGAWLTSLDVTIVDFVNRFYNRKTRPVFTKKYKKEFLKYYKTDLERWDASQKYKLDAVTTSIEPFFPSIAAIKKHWTANNESIEWLKP